MPTVNQSGCITSSNVISVMRSSRNSSLPTVILLRENERYEKSSHSGSEKVSIGDYSYSTQSSESSDSGSTASDDENSLNVIRLLRAAGCLYAGVEVLE